jgi:uncharacterized protein (DUF1800 family)
MPLDDRDKIAHLLRRAGFAARPEEIEAGVARGLMATVDQLVNFETTPDNLATPPPGLDYNIGTPPTNPPRGYFENLLGWWLNAMILTTRPLQEKMVLFWHQLFATGVDGVQDQRQMYLQNENFRGNFNPDTSQLSHPDPASPFPVGNFRLILDYLTKDPAMLFWLDNYLNRKKDLTVGTNENFARELHELFSMGVKDPVTGAPNYTETDIRQASRALTGWTILFPGRNNPNADMFPRRFLFNSGQHDFGPYQHLGNGGGNNANFVFDNIVRYRNPNNPSTDRQSVVGRFLGWRLFKFFGYDEPEPELIRALADVFDGANGGQPYIIRNLLRTIFTPGNIVSEAFYSDKAFKAHVKSPTEFVVSTFRLLKPEGILLNYTTVGQPESLSVSQALSQTINAMNQMGQYLMRPFDVSGWKEGLNWINTTFDLARFNYGNSLIALGTSQGGLSTDALRSLLVQNNAQTPEQVVDFMTNLMLQRPVSSQTRTNLVNYLRVGNNGTGSFNFNLATNETIDNKVRGLIHLIMASPDFSLS